MREQRRRQPKRRSSMKPRLRLVDSSSKATLARMSTSSAYHRLNRVVTALMAGDQKTAEEESYWTYGELIRLAEAGHQGAARMVAEETARRLSRISASPVVAEFANEKLDPWMAWWLQTLLERLLKNPMLFRRVLAPRDKRGRCRADRSDLWLTTQHWMMKITVARLVQQVHESSREKINTVADDIAQQVSAWPFPTGMKPPTAKTVERWYYEMRRLEIC